MTTPRMQESAILPPHPAIPGLDYFSGSLLAGGTNCDYFDCFELNGRNLGLALADVRGQGPAASRLTASLRGMLRALHTTRGSSLKTMVRTVDRLFAQVAPDHCYATLFFAEYDPASGRLRYVNAGHEPPFVLRRNGTHTQTLFLEPGGPMIGMLRESAYREGVVALHPGDLLIAYTDGLCETANPAGEEWGWPRFLEAIEQADRRRARDMVDEVMSAATAFAAGTPPRDDATLFIGRVRDTQTVSPRWEVEWLAAPTAA